MVRAPRSVATAEPAAPPSSSAATTGAPCRITPRPPAAPETDEAPTCEMKLPTCTATMTPNGIDTSNAGIAVTLMMNQAWLMVSRQGWRNRIKSVTR